MLSGYGCTPRRWYMVRAATDMRKSFNGLADIIQCQLGGNPMSGDAFVFTNRRRNRLKILVWSDAGFWVCALRISQGCLRLPWRPLAADSPECRVVAPHALAAVISETIPARQR